MAAQYDYIKIDAYDIEGEFMTKDLGSQLKKYNISRRGFLGHLVLKKDNKIMTEYYGALTVCNHTGEYQFWIIAGMVKDIVKL